MFRWPDALRGCLAAAALSAGGAPPAANDAPQLVAAGSVAHDALDGEGETLGALGSGLAYDEKADRWLALADRGPGDGAIDYRPRYHTLRVERRLGAAAGQLRITVESTTLFLDPEGRPFTGHLPEGGAGDPELPRYGGRICFDPEAIALAPDGTLYVGEEYGPFVYQFSREGRCLRRLVPPDAYLPRDGAGNLSFGEDARAGRSSNHGFEGLAVSPDGGSVTALLQGPLLQDGGRKGALTRLLTFDAASGKPKSERAYAFESAAAANARRHLSGEDQLKKGEIQGCELLAVDPHRFLVLERDGRGADGSVDPRPAGAKSVWLVDVAGATDLLARPRPGPLAPSPDLVLPTKTLLIDLAGAPWQRFAPEWPGLAAKWEGLALRRGSGDLVSLLASSDNDFLTPVLRVAGQDVPFPRARRAVDTQFLLFSLRLPPP